MNEPSKSFCVLPWVHRFINIGGENQVCCTSEEHDNDICDDEGNQLNAQTVVDNEVVMNSNFMKNLRRQMLNGEKPNHCRRCWTTEASGGMSRRQVENRVFTSDVPELLRVTDADGHIRDLKARSLDLRLGNICNLACRMCSPRSSTGWHREWMSVEQTLFPATAESLKEMRDFDWYKRPEVLEEFKKMLPQLTHLHFAGGEPLLVREMIGFLRAAVESGDSQHIEISYNTNLTRLPSEAKELWRQFAGVKLLCSLDGYGRVNDLIRHPSKWNTIDKNLRDIEQNFDRYGISEVLIMCTVQICNILSLGDLYDYLAQGFQRVTPFPMLIDLHYPPYYRTQNLPQDLKDLARKRLEDVLKRSQKRIDSGQIPAHYAYLLDSIRSSLNFMEAENHEEWLPDFFRAAESKDRLRDEDMYSVIPEFLSLKSDSRWIRLESPGG